ncbi:SMP-30/gluconolactonase/LRE family protein [Nonomuraea soli]|uniref:Sugar lactone lactonase YvrE n=1 Tax=Nonomuraea soli TaxID=1032476 RepID=A0A7W0CPP3_9ACTN|nr:superoxide dismutase [Nonomuraea soli]MBA2895084.1 sugar lactone lactonase YvrE [Nonomuraea soli]
MKLRIIATAVACVTLTVMSAAPAQAGPPRPDTIALPNGWQPEGIAIDRDGQAYFGSRATGSIYRADLKTGQGTIISQGPGTPSLGLKTDKRDRLFVAGGTGGDARVIDTGTGAVLKSYQLAAAGASFVNDVILHRGAAYFTDSRNPAIYKLTLGRRGALPEAATAIPLTGAMQYTTGNNANGIEVTPDRTGLLIVQSNTGKLFRADPASGVTTEVDLGGETLVNGDGLLLRGTTLYVVQNRLNTVTVLTLDEAATKGTVTKRITDPRFDVPTTVAAWRGRLYLPNARFTTTPTPETPYTVVAVKK